MSRKILVSPPSVTFRDFTASGHLPIRRGTSAEIQRASRLRTLTERSPSPCCRLWFSGARNHQRGICHSLTPERQGLGAICRITESMERIVRKELEAWAARPVLGEGRDTQSPATRPWSFALLDEFFGLWVIPRLWLLEIPEEFVQMACGIDAVGVLRAPGQQFLHSP
jgi:hypothetical protein